MKHPREVSFLDALKEDILAVLYRRIVLLERKVFNRGDLAGLYYKVLLSADKQATLKIESLTPLNLKFQGVDLKQLDNFKDMLERLIEEAEQGDDDCLIQKIDYSPILGAEVNDALRITAKAAQSALHFQTGYYKAEQKEKKKAHLQTALSAMSEVIPD